MRTEAHHHYSTSPRLHTREHSSASFGLKSHFENNKEGFSKCTRGINKPTSIPANQYAQRITALSRTGHCPICFCAIRVGGDSSQEPPQRGNMPSNYTPLAVLRQHKPLQGRRKVLGKNMICRVPSIIVRTQHLPMPPNWAWAEQNPNLVPDVPVGGRDANLSWAKLAAWTSSLSSHRLGTLVPVEGT